MKQLYVTHILEQESVALGGAAEKSGGIFLRLSTAPGIGGETLDVEIGSDVLAQVVKLVSEKRVVASVEASAPLHREEPEWGPDVPLEDYDFQDPRVPTPAPAEIQHDDDLEPLDHDDDLATFSPAE